MLVGIISDMHDNLPNVEKANNRLNQEKVDLVLHAGDYVAPFVIPKFKALNCRLIGVFGNNDGDHAFLRQRFAETSICEVHGRFADILVDGFRIALLHGDERELLNALINSKYFNTVVYGHEHVASSRKNGGPLVINSGEVCGYLTSKSTLAVFDTAKREVIIITL